MKFPFFTSFIIFVLITQFAIRRTSRKEKQADEDFWEKERRSNSVRRQSLDDLAYICIPVDDLPFGALGDDTEAASLEETLRALARGQDDERSRIVNLTGISNTDLKLQYGAPNITRLSIYDQNYTSLVTTLQSLGKLLYERGLYAEAERFLSFAVSTGTDISATYRLLCDIYTNHLGLGAAESRSRIAAMIPTAENLNSLSRDSIVAALQEAVSPMA